MPKPRFNSLETRPLFDIASYARGGPGRRDTLSAPEVEQITRTVRRAPEAVVKVLPRGTNNFGSVRRHFGYIGRYGALDLETDDGEQIGGKNVGRELMDDWDLDLEQYRRQTVLATAGGRPPLKLVHKLMFSMPAGTPASGVLSAVRDFLREEFGLKHRYAFVLHTNERHPHVHAIVKAVSEQGERLNIRKGTLREWRREFARHLREQGIEANATERAVRGETRTSKLDGIYRARKRGTSHHVLARADAYASELRTGRKEVESGRAKLLETRQLVQAGWLAASEHLAAQGLPELAADIRQFVTQMPAARTEREEILHEMRNRDSRAGLPISPTARTREPVLQQRSR